jgi:hypothetical protein
MKTRIKIIAMLMSMIIGTLTVSAQSARRGNSEQKRTNAVKTSRKTPDRAKAVRTTQRTPKRELTAQRGRNNKMSSTNRNNPKSTYRTPDKTVHLGKTYVNPKPDNRQGKQSAVRNRHNSETHFDRNTTVHHRHHYYPAKKVKIHIHPMTYKSNYRALYYPRYSEIIWTRPLHRHYVSLYPHYSAWHYNWGYRIQTMSAFEAEFNVGEIARVYGRVYATWYNNATDDLLLFFGGEYPGQVFTMVVPGNVARRYSWRPERYFLGQHISATGLITMFEGRAEMVLKKRSQLNVY